MTDRKRTEDGLTAGRCDVADADERTSLEISDRSTPERERTASAPAEASDLELLRTFEPVLAFTRGERFYPMDVERYVSHSSLWVHLPDGTDHNVIPEGELDIAKLVEPRERPFGTIEFLQFNEPLGVADSARVLTEAARLHREEGEQFHPGIGRLARGGFLPRVFDAFFSLSLLLRGRVPPVTAAAAELEYNGMMAEDAKYVYYGRVVRESGWVVLQYWFFYCYNNWRSSFNGVNDHEADWENILVYLYEEDGRLYPEWTMYASHDSTGPDLRRRFDDVGQLDLVEGHPVVWVGAGSHAAYFRPGEYQATVALWMPQWTRVLGRSFAYVWTEILGQAAGVRDPFRIPFVDYARGDGKRIGPGQDLEWTPVVIDASIPWVSRYRGLWGLYARDPISGENAPAGPMYTGDGSLRRSWYDPLGFAGVDREPPPPLAPAYLREDRERLVLRQSELEQSIAEKGRELHALGAEMSGMEGNPHLRARHASMTELEQERREELRIFRKELWENAAVLAALDANLRALEAGRKRDPRSHIRKLAEPVPCRNLRFNRAAEAWAAVSLSLILLGVVGLLVFARGYLWVGMVAMAGALLLTESLLRGHYSRTITLIASLLTVATALILLIHFWLWVIIAVLAVLALFLLVQKLRELRR